MKTIITITFEGTDEQITDISDSIESILQEQNVDYKLEEKSEDEQ